MADKITNFEDYKKKDNVPGDTTDINIQIEDPVNFFNAQEREEFFQERQKEQLQQQMQQMQQQQPVQQNPYVQQPVQPNPYVQQPVQQNPYVQQPVQPQYTQDDYNQMVNNGWNQNQGYYQGNDQGYGPQYDDEDYDEEYDEEYDEDYEDEEESSGFPIELFIRISSIITGIIILAFLAIVAKVKIYDRYLAPDPDEEQVTVSELPIPSGFTEKGGTVVVTAQELNLRSGPGTDSSVLGVVTKGTELTRVAVNSEGTWALVEYNGQRVYASMKYLTDK